MLTGIAFIKKCYIPNRLYKYSKIWLTGQNKKESRLISIESQPKKIVIVFVVVIGVVVVVVHVVVVVIPVVDPRNIPLKFG